jgi:ABC-type transport system substrate-binding protein
LQAAPSPGGPIDKGCGRRLAERQVASYHRRVGLRRPALVALGVVSALALGADSVPGTAANSRGTLRVVVSQGPPTLDPALTVFRVGWGSPHWYGTCATLMAFRDAPAPDGFQVEPEAAAGPPEVSRDGRTYTFTVRKGLRFSDGTPLTAKNFHHALGRVLHPVMRSPNAERLADVKDVDSSRWRLRIELRKPSADLATRLAFWYACPVPLGFPVDPAGVPLMVSSGPYYVADYEPDKRIVLERNPHYRGRRPSTIDRFLITFGGTIEENIEAVADGRADILGNEIPTEFRSGLARRFGVNKSQLFRVRGIAIRMLVLNTSRSLFRDNVALRKAVNLALDRPALLRVSGSTSVANELTDQILTRWMPGWVDHRLYPLEGPNLGLAARLADGNQRRGKAILWTSLAENALDQAEVIKRNLREIGLEVEVQSFSTAVFNARAGVPGAPYDLSLGTTLLGYPDPANVIVRLLGGENARKPSGNENGARFDVPEYNKRMATANRLTGTARFQAFSRLDADIMRREAPWAPINQHSSWLLVSKRVGCLEMHPVFRIDFAAICLD